MFSGGAEAVEAALRLAKAATGRHEIIGFWGGFHGKTSGVLPLLGSDFKQGLGPFLPGHHLTPYADCYRCPLRLRYPDCGIACADYIRDVIRHQTSGDIAAIIVEPMQGTAGNVVPPEGFLRAVQAIAREHGALLIADEMITGFGRTGLMWGAEHDGVVPDIMTVGKGIGGGFPLSAVISTDAITTAKPWSNPSHSSSSYGGNPLAAAAGLAALQIILEEDLVANADRVGRAMLARLGQMQEKYACVGEVRGKGLLLGVELVRDRKTREPVPRAVTQALYQECLRRGLVAMTYATPIRINPPLVIARGDGPRGSRHPRRGAGGRPSRARAPVAMWRGALIGFGNVAAHGHLPGWQRREDVTLVAVADVRAERRDDAAAQRCPAQHGTPRRTRSSTGPRWTSWTSARRPPPTPRSWRPRWSAASTSSARSRSSVALRRCCDWLPRCAAARRLVVQTVHNWHHAPIVRRTRRADRRGRGGRDHRVTWHTLRTGPAAAADGPVRTGASIPRIAGGGVLTDHGWHVSYVVQRWIGQPPLAVSACLETRRHRAFAVEDTASLQVTFPAAKADIFLTWAAETRGGTGRR